MRSPRDHVPTALFERLVDETPKQPEEYRPLRAFDREHLRVSVLREVRWLLNTRCPLPESQLEDPRSTIDYGIPDLSGFSPADPEHQHRLARIVSRSIAAFEPRLQQVQATVVGPVDMERSLRLQISAILVVESVREPLSFFAIVRRGNEGVEVHED